MTRIYPGPALLLALSACASKPLNSVPLIEAYDPGHPVAQVICAALAEMDARGDG